MQAVYVSSNQFNVNEDKTSEFLAGRRVRALCGSEYKYSTVYSSVYSSPYTTITIEENILISNLSAVHYGIINIGEQGSFPKHSHDGNEGTGGALSLLTLSDTPSVYEEGEYLRSTTSGVEWTIPEAEAIVIRVKEENISAITKGQACTIVGSSGVKSEVGLCDCDDPNKLRIIGLAQDDIFQDGDGVVVYKGIITNVDTRTTNSGINPNGEIWASEELLWVSNIPGGLTKVRPVSGRSIKAARTIKGNSTTDTLIVISHENTIWATAASGEDVVLRVGDSAGVNKVSIRGYNNSEVAAFDSYGNLTISGTVDGVDIDGFKSEFDNKTEWFLTEGLPSGSIGKEDDISVNQTVGTVYKKEPEYINDSGVFYPATNTGGGYWRTVSPVFTPGSNGYIGKFGNYPMHSWVRFINTAIPSGVTIVSAFVKFRSGDTISTTPVNTNIFFNNVDSAVSPTDYNEAEALVLTSEINWDDIEAWVDHEYYNTPELKSILQTVIDRSGWSSGNALQIVIKNDSSPSSTYRELLTYGSIGYAAELHVEWYVTAGVPTWKEKLSPDFLKLSDTPTTYSGVSGKYLKTTSSGIEFVEDLYTKSEVDTISGTLQEGIDGKPDTEWFLTEGTPSIALGKKSDVAVDQLIGTIYKRLNDPGENESSGTFYPAVGGDDGRRFPPSSYSNSTDYIFLGTAYGEDWHSWIRFSSISIPKEAVIVEAFIRFTAYDSRSGANCNLKCYFNTSDNAIAPGDGAAFDALSLTEFISWNNIDGWVDGSQYDTPDLSSILQAIINREGWINGNAVQLIIKPDISSASIRRYSAYEHLSGNEKAELHITWASDPWEENLTPDFLKLSDTPTTYSGSVGKYLKSTTSGIEFSDDLYTKSEVDTISGTLQTNIDGKADTIHTHDDRYYTELEVDTISGTLQTNIDDMPVTLLELSDTPTTYSGSVDKYLKTTSSGIIFSDIDSEYWESVDVFLDENYSNDKGLPTQVERGLFKGYSMPIWSTPANQYEELVFRIRAPFRWDGVTNPTFMILVSISATEDVGDKFKFQMEWESKGVSNVVPDTTAEVLTDEVAVTDGTAYYSYLASTSLDSAKLIHGDNLQFRVRRVTATDPQVNNEIIVWHWDSRWKMNKLGTVSE